MPIRSTSKRPTVFAVCFLDRQVVDARVTPAHQPVLVELPVLVAVGAKPVSRVVMPFVNEAHCDAIFCERPQLLDEAIVELSCPLAPEEVDDLLPAVCEFRAVSPSGIE